MGLIGHFNLCDNGNEYPAFSSLRRGAKNGEQKEIGERRGLPSPTPLIFLLAVFCAAPQLTERLEEATSSDDVVVVTYCV